MQGPEARVRPGGFSSVIIEAAVRCVAFAVVKRASWACASERMIVGAMSEHRDPPDEPPVRLSVVIPCFNAEETIAEQLDALAEQDWSEPWELIIADNGSTDGTRQVIDRYRERIRGLRVVDAPGRKGAEHARNEGVKAARGSLLAFCDADDVVAPDWVRQVARALEQVDLAACRLDGDRLNEPAVLEIRPCPQQDGLMRFRYSDFLPFASTCGLGVRRAAFEALGGFDEDLFLGGDIDFCWRAQLQGFSLQFVPEALVHYRMRSDPRGIYRQTFLYAMWTVPVYTRYLPHGMPPVPWHKGVRMWLRLLLRVPSLVSAPSRTKWLRQFAYRWGLVRGSIRWRRLVL